MAVHHVLRKNQSKLKEAILHVNIVGNLGNDCFQVRTNDAQL